MLRPLREKLPVKGARHEREGMRKLLLHQADGRLRLSRAEPRAAPEAVIGYSTHILDHLLTACRATLPTALQLLPCAEWPETRTLYLTQIFKTLETTSLLSISRASSVHYHI